MSDSIVAVNCICCGSEDMTSSPAVLMPFVAHRALGWEPVIIDESWELRTIEKGYAYSICKSLYCNNCGLLFLDIRFTDQEIKSLYNGYRGREYTRLREYYEPGYIERNEFLNKGNNYILLVEDFLKPYISEQIKILDWGGDTGVNTPFKDVAEYIDIYDISDKITNGNIAYVNLKETLSRTYSLIVCSNVLEHVPYPLEILEKIFNIMNNSTILYIEVPYENLMIDKNEKLPDRKKHWHEHINFFSELSLKKLAANANFEIISMRTIRALTGGNFNNIFQIACRIKIPLVIDHSI
jgi:hypothetical protein